MESLEAHHSMWFWLLRIVEVARQLLQGVNRPAQSPTGPQQTAFRQRIQTFYGHTKNLGCFVPGETQFWQAVLFRERCRFLVHDEFTLRERGGGKSNGAGSPL